MKRAGQKQHEQCYLDFCGEKTPVFMYIEKRLEGNLPKIFMAVILRGLDPQYFLSLVSVSMLYFLHFQW